MASFPVKNTFGIPTIVFLSVYGNLFGCGGGGGIPVVQAVSVEEDLTITLSEKMALDKFKPRVIPLLPHDYMKQDIYLMRWLRAKNLNLDAAEQMLKNNIRWRQEQKMDTIHTEDWRDMVADFPYSNDTIDKQDRPIGTVSFGLWNIRAMALAGKMPRLQRYLVKLIEEAQQLVVHHQQQGKNVTQFKIIVNLDGFNLIQQGCPTCLPLYANFVNTYEQYYPGQADEVIYINTPPIFDVILGVVRPLFSPATRKAVVYLGQDKKEWVQYLDKTIDRSQRRPEFGGTMKD